MEQKSKFVGNIFKAEHIGCTAHEICKGCFQLFHGNDSKCNDAFICMDFHFEWNLIKIVTTHYPKYVVDNI